jgi:hypothetical protein
MRIDYQSARKTWEGGTIGQKTGAYHAIMTKYFIIYRQNARDRVGGEAEERMEGAYARENGQTSEALSTPN